MQGVFVYKCGFFRNITIGYYSVVCSSTAIADILFLFRCLLVDYESNLENVISRLCVIGFL